jgi:hypothetical protein
MIQCCVGRDAHSVHCSQEKKKRGVRENTYEEKGCHGRTCNTKPGNGAKFMAMLSPSDLKVWDTVLLQNTAQPARTSSVHSSSYN